MVLGVGDMDISMQITPAYVSGYEKYLSSAPLVCMDGNIPVDTVEYVCNYCALHNVPGKYSSVHFYSPTIHLLNLITSIYFLYSGMAPDYLSCII